jgi:hypothetical protein
VNVSGKTAQNQRKKQLQSPIVIGFSMLWRNEFATSWVLLFIGIKVQ